LIKRDASIQPAYAFLQHLPSDGRGERGLGSALTGPHCSIRGV
jgi:hypothetical protein